MRIRRHILLTAAALTLSFIADTAFAQAPAPTKAPFTYLPAKAYHVLPGTHNGESGYFSLVEGIDGKIYLGAAKYGENSFLIEFDPTPGNEKQRVVIDTHKLNRLTDTGYAAQAKIHTKNFVGPSGKVYVGSMQGHATDEEKKNNVQYKGGYVMTYDPKADKAESLGMPLPGTGEGVIDVVADESRGLIYVVTYGEHHWVIYDTKAKRYREPDPSLRLFGFASTVVDDRGRAHTITKDYQLATYDPAADKVSVRDLMADGKKLALPADAAQRGGWIPSWSLSADKKTVYLIRMNRPEVFAIDLTGDPAAPAKARNLGKIIEAPDDQTDCRSGISVGPDGMIYAAIAVNNRTGYGSAAQLNHLARMDPRTGKAEDLGVLTIKNPDYFDFDAKGPDGNAKPWTYGIIKLPDGTLTPQYQHLGSIVTRGGASYTLALYPFTLLRVDGVAKPAGSGGTADAEAAQRARVIGYAR